MPRVHLLPKATAHDACAVSFRHTFFSVSLSDFTPIARTGNSRSDYSFGRGMQNMRFVTDTGTSTGAFPAMNTFTGARFIKITKLSGRHAGEHAIFQFVAPLTRSVRATILNCGTGSGYTNSPSTTAWTAAYSGTKIDGTLPLYTRSNQQQALRYMFLCGINTSSDDDHSILAFTYYMGNSNNVSLPPARSALVRQARAHVAPGASCRLLLLWCCCCCFVVVVVVVVVVVWLKFCGARR